MREILFRGKRIDNGEWVFGDLIREPWDIAFRLLLVAEMSIAEKNTQLWKKLSASIPD